MRLVLLAVMCVGHNFGGAKEIPLGFTRILVVSDNQWMLDRFAALLARRDELEQGRSFRFACSPKSPGLIGKAANGQLVEAIDIKTDYERIIDRHDLIISAHCKQFFPTPLVRACRCINVHPGLNPHNRGWYPQVFCILNGLPLGATIHEIDEQLDHGRIIDQVEVPLHAWDTSLDAYLRVQQAEALLLERSIDAILNDAYTARVPASEGNVNYRKDFDELCRIDLQEQVTFQQAIDRLRALTHGSFKNAYFIDPVTNKKVFVRLNLAADEC